MSRLFICVILVGLFLKVSICGVSSSWQKEVDESLSRNIQGGCGWRISNNNQLDEIAQSLDQSNEFTVNVYHPSKREIKTHNKIPVIQSVAYPSLVKQLLEEKMESWAQEKGLMWQLPNDHPAQNRPYCMNITLTAAEGNVNTLYEDLRKQYRTFYLLQAKYAYIHPMGSVGVSCGFYQGVEGCETRWEHGAKWWRQCSAHLNKAKLPWSTLFLSEATASAVQLRAINHCKVYGLTPQRHRRVFVIPALWDFNYHHFVVDSLARLSRHVTFLRENTDVKIMIRASDLTDITRNRTAEFRAAAYKMRSSLFTLLGLGLDRVVYGPVLAEEVLIPRALRCSYALSNPMEIRLMGKVMVSSAHKQLQSSGNKQQQLAAVKSSTDKKNLVILQRYAHLQTWGWREWDNATTAVVVQAFSEKFPQHNVVVLSSIAANSPDYCLACEIMTYTKADILVGVHGAGLTNMMLMPIGGLVVELATQYNPAVMPVCGYYGSLSAICGHHHYLFAYNRKDEPPIDTQLLAGEVLKFYMRVHT